jgi:hypothetical protein
MSWDVRHKVWVLAAVLMLGVVAGMDARTQGADKSLFVSVVDANGRPVTDLTAAEFAIREDNVMREVVAVKRATQPLYIQILADTTKQSGAVGMMSRNDTAGGASELIRDIRSSLTSLVKYVSEAAPEAQMALMEFGQAAIPVVNFTNKTADLEKGVTRLFPKPDAASVLLEAMISANKELEKKPSPRKAIIVLNIEPGDEQSREQPKEILESFRKSGASLWAVSVQRGELKNPTRDLILNNLTKITGGRREFIVGQSAIENWLKVFADALLAQYELTYKRPDAKTPASQVLVGITRQGLRTHANNFAPK